MRTWTYEDPSGRYTLTDAEILERYWGWWSGQMAERHPGRPLTPEECIQDFVVVNWAWEEKHDAEGDG